MALKSTLSFTLLGLLAFTQPMALRAEEGEDLMKKSDCFSCHTVNRKVVGPAYLDVAKKYKSGGAKAVKTLVTKVKHGGSGNWGAVPMAGHPNLPDADIEKMVKWVLSRTEANSKPTPAPTPKPVEPKAEAVVEEKAEAPKKKKKKKIHHAPAHHGHHGEELAFGTDEELRSAMNKQDCFGCHSGLRGDGDPEEMPWPSFAKIENRYKSSRPVTALVKKIRSNEGSTTWGKTPHPRYGHLPVEGVEKMVAYILDGKASKASQPAAQVELSPEEWMRKKSDCFTCHALDKKMVGPAYKEVAKKYLGAGSGQVASLVKKVKEGGSGVWGTVPMSAHASVPDAQIEKAVRWVLQQK